MSSPAELLLNARFQLEEQVGQGAMGVVYKAWDREAKQPVAVKIMTGSDGGKARRFMSEGATLAQLDHAAIVRYVAHGTSSQGETYLVMEWLEGETLDKRLQSGPLGIEDTLALARRVTDGLGNLHRRGIVHRDLKPSNLFLPSGSVGEAKILDFGIARHIGDDPHLTRTGAVVGTPLYMSPEQAGAADQVDERSDIYSLGTVLFECLAGRPPFVGATVMAILCKICLEEPPRLRELVAGAPAALETLLGVMMAKDPAHRLRDAHVLAAELAGITSASSPAVVSLRPKGTLTEVERRVLCAIFVRSESLCAAESRDAPTISAVVASEVSVTTGAVDAIPSRIITQRVSAHGGRLQRLLDGSMVVTFPGELTPTDQAAEAGRCALSLGRDLRDAQIVVCTGRAATFGRLPVGDVIDRGVALLQSTGVGSIRLDTTTAGLLDTQFEVDRDRDEIRLLKERERAEIPRTVLGKAVACVGREPELALLEGIFAAAKDSQAQAVLVTAPAGMGKTRLRQELVSQLERRGEKFQLLLGRADSVRSGSPFGLIAPAIRRAAGVSTQDSPSTRRHKLIARVARHFDDQKAARMAEFLGELTGIHFPSASSPALHAARQDARLMGDQMRAAWVDWLEAECAEKPVLLVLEDLHWGDVSSVQLVDSALRVLRERPLMVLALARPEVSVRFSRLWEDLDLRTFAIHPLPRKMCERLVAELLDPDTPRDLVSRVAEQSEGNPFFLEELARGVSLGQTELPETVLGMLQTRLDALGSDAARVLRAASIFGQTFDLAGVRPMIGGLELRTTEALRVLVQHEVIQPQQGSELNQFVFRHALVREASYATLTEGDRVLGHRLAGEWLVEAGETDAMVLADHFDKGADRENAARWHARAGVQALQGDDLDAALARAERSRACGAKAEILSEGYFVEATVRYWRTEFAAAAASAACAVEHAPHATPGWFHAIRELVGSLAEQGKHDEAVPWVKAVKAVKAATPLTPEAAAAQVACLGWSAGALVNVEQRELVRSIFEQARAILATLPAPDPWVLARVHYPMGRFHGCSGDVMNAIQEMERALSAAKEAGDVRMACLILGDQGCDWLEVGEYALAESVLRQVVEEARRQSLRLVEVDNLPVLGLALTLLGRLDEARATLNKAAEVAERSGWPSAPGTPHLFFSMLAYVSGDFIEAEHRARLAINQWPPLYWMGAIALSALAQALLTQGRPAEAFEASKEATAILEHVGGMRFGESLVGLMNAETRMAIGDRQGALAALRAAGERIVARADRITDLRVRANFVAIRENARTFELVRAWGLEMESIDRLAPTRADAAES